VVLFGMLTVLKGQAHLLAVSHDGQFIVAGDVWSNIAVWTTSKWEVLTAA